MNIKIIPYQDRIAVEVIADDESNTAGIIIPDSAKEKPTRGTVVSVGSGRTSENGTKVPIECQVGDKVLFSKFAGQKSIANGKDYLIIRESDIISILVQFVG